MGKKTWVGNLAAGTSSLTAVAQVDTFTWSNVGAGAETWTMTVTGEDGSTQTETFVDDGTPTTAELTTLAVAAWNASKKILFTPITASGSTTLILTADTAGIPFSVAITASGTGTTSRAATTANIGAYDYQTAQNWKEGAIPVAADEVTVDGSINILYGLRNTSVELLSFTVKASYSGAIGSEAARLAIDLDNAGSLDFSGSGVAYISVFSAATTVRVRRTASVAAGEFGLFLHGTAIATLHAMGGSTRVVSGSTVVTSRVYAGATLDIPSGCTITTVSSAGTCSLESACTTFTTLAGNTTIDGAGTITTLNPVGGTTTCNTTGTITTLTIDGGLCDMTKSQAARTVTNCAVNGGELRADSAAVTFTNAITGIAPLSIRRAA